MATTVGHAQIEISPELNQALLRRMETRLRAEMTRIERTLRPEVRLQLNTSRYRTDLQRATSRRVVQDVELRVSTRGYRQRVQEVTSRQAFQDVSLRLINIENYRARLRAVTSTRVFQNVNLRITNTGAYRRDLQALLAASRAIQQVTLRIANRAEYRRELREFLLSVRATQNIHPDLVRQAEYRTRLQALTRPVTQQIRVNMDRSALDRARTAISRLRTNIGLLRSAVIGLRPLWVAFTTVLISAIPHILSVAQGLGATATVAGGVLLSGLFGAAGAFGVLKAAMLAYDTEQVRAMGHLDNMFSGLDRIGDVALEVGNIFWENVGPGFGHLANSIANAGAVAWDFTRDFARAMDRVAMRMADFVNSPTFRSQFANVMNDNVWAMESFGNAGVNAFRSVMSVAEAAGPQLRRFANWIERITLKWAEFLDNRGTAQLREDFERWGDAAAQLGRIIGNVFATIYEFFVAISPITQDTADGMERVTAKWKEWMSASENQEKVREFFQELKDLDWGRIYGWIAKIVVALVAINISNSVLKFLSLMGPAGPLALGIALLVGGLVQLYLTNENFRNSVNDLWAAITENLWPAMQQLLGTFEDIVTGIGRLFGLDWENWADVAETAVNVLSTAINWLTNALNFAMPVIKPVIMGVVGAMIAMKVATLATTAVVLAKVAALKALMFIGKIWRATVLIMTAAQWLWNAALYANPIGLVVIAIAALVAGIIWAYHNFEGFREVVDKVWNAIKTGALWVWHNVLQPFFNWIVENALPVVKKAFEIWWNVVSTYFKAWGAVLSWIWNEILSPFFGWIVDTAAPAVATAFSWLWENILSPVFTAIGTIASWLWHNILEPMFNFIGWVITEVIGPAITWWWQNIVQPAFTAIGTVASWLWRNVLEPMFNFIGHIITEYVGPAIMWLWQNVIQPGFRIIGTIAMWLWQNVLAPMFRFIGDIITNVVGPMFLWLWQNIIVPAWNGIITVIRGAWVAIQAIFRGLAHVVGTAITIFTNFRSFIAAVWNAIKNAISIAWNWILENVLRPIGRFFTQTIPQAFNRFRATVISVWNAVRSGISTAWNWILDNVLRPIGRFFTQTIPQAFNKFKSVVSSVWDGVRAAISAAWNWIVSNIADPIVSFFRNKIPAAFNKFKSTVSNVWNAIKSAIGAAWNWIKSNIVNPVISFFQNNMPAAFNRFRSVVSSVWNAIKGAISGVWNWIKSNVINPVISFFQNNIPAAFERFKGVVSSVWDGVKNAMSNAWNWIKSNVIDKILGLPDTIRNALSGLADIISGAFKTAFNAIAGFWNDGPGSLSMDIPDWVPGVGGEEFEMPKIPELASGGMLRGPGTGTSDSMVARVSDGEFVQQASAVRRYGTGFMEALNAEKINIVGAFAKGGLVGLPRFNEGGQASTGGGSGGSDSGESTSTSEGIKGLDDLAGWQALQEVLAAISESLMIVAEKWLQLTQILQLDWTAIAGFIEQGAIRIGEALSILAVIINEHLAMFSEDFLAFISVVGQFQNMFSEEQIVLFQEQLTILMETLRLFATQVTTIFNQMILAIRTNMQNMVNQLVVILQQMSATIIATLQNLLVQLQAIFAQLLVAFNNFRAQMLAALNSFTTTFRNTMNLFQTSVQNAWNAFLTNLTTRWAAWAADMLSRLNAFTATYFNALNAHQTRVQNAWNAWLTNLTTRWAAWAADMLSRLNAFTANYFNAINAFMTRVQEAWNSWLTNLTTRWANWASDMTNRFNNWFSESLSSFRDFTAEMFNAWNELWDRFEQRWDEFSPLVRTEIPGVFTDLKNGTIETFQEMADGIRTEWDKIEDYTSEPVKFVVETVYNGGIGNLFDAASEVFEDMPSFSSASVPFATGGIYPGYTPGKDVGLASVSGGEAIMRPEWTRAIGAENIHAMNRVARTEGTSGLRRAFAGHFFTGGIVGEILSNTAAVKGATDEEDATEFLESDEMKAAADSMETGIDSVPDTGIRHLPRRTGVSLWDHFLGGMVNMITPLIAAASAGSGGDTGIGSSELLTAMAAFVRGAASGMSVSSGLREGDPGYHGKSRAIDMIFSDGSQNAGAGSTPGGQAKKAADAIKANFMGDTLELIWDPLGNQAVWNGGLHRFTGGGAGPGTHADHIHWAYGGTVEALEAGNPSAGGGGASGEDAEWGGGGDYEVSPWGSIPKATGLFDKAKEAVEAAKAAAASSSAALVDADGAVTKVAYEQAKSMNVSDKVMLALFMAGIVESGFRTGASVRGVDHDSAGFLQQRPSQGWGSVSQVEDPAYATRAFVDRAKPIEGQHSKAGDLAQAVQRSAFPDKYQAVRSQAVSLIKGFDSNFDPGNFDMGGWLMPGKLGINQTSQPEAVLTQQQLGVLTTLATERHECEQEINVFVGNEPIDARIEKKHKQRTRKRARDFTSRKR